MFSFTPIFCHAQSLYFPPTGDSWSTINPEELNWCQDPIDSLYDFLETNQSKSFILLKDGKIVLESYFNGHSSTANWYWASAGKTLTAFMVGQAQQQGLLDIYEPTSNYLGEGWTSCTPEQEQAITIRNQLTMTTGLDDGVVEDDCTESQCLEFLADAGTRWAYHNAPYTLLDSVMQIATGMSLNAWCLQNVAQPIGMQGLWLNNTESFMFPETQFVFPGNYAANAPPDMYAAIGRDGQYICVVPSQNLVWIRMGENPDGLDVPILMIDDIWELINALPCEPNKVEESRAVALSVMPNPSCQYWRVESPVAIRCWSLVDMQGRIVNAGLIHGKSLFEIDATTLDAGNYILSLEPLNGNALHERLVRR